MKLSHPRQPAPPTAEEVARLAGVGDLRLGKHFLRDEQKQPVGCVWVRSFWFAEILPSFHPPAVLAVVVAKGEAFQDCVSPDWVKGVFATHQEAAVALLEADPVPAVLDSQSLFALDDNTCLDGIAYTFTLETTPLRAALQFGNPTQPCLLALEAGLLALARKIATQAGSEPLLGVVESWGEYVNDKRAAAR